jgi:hypothetical protein
MLIWSLLAAVAKPSRGWIIALATFIVCQYEYGFALLVITSAGLFALLFHQREAGPTITWLLGGSLVSFLVFGVQILGFAGPATVWEQLVSGVAHRGPLAGAQDPVWATWIALAGHYHQPLPSFVLWSITTAPVVLLGFQRGRYRYGLAALQVALVVGLLTTAFVLRGYYLDSFVAHVLPSWQLLLPVAIATVAADVAVLVGRLISASHLEPRLAAVGAGLLVPLVLLVNTTHVYEKYPPYPAAFVPILVEKYQGQGFTAPSGFHMLAYALTGGPTTPSEYVVDQLSDHQRLVRELGGTGSLLWFCVARPGAKECDDATHRMQRRGSVVVDQDLDFVIVRLVQEH